MSADAPTAESKLLGPLRRVRRRLRALTALDGAARVAVLAATTALVTVYLDRLGWLGPRGRLIAFTVAGTVLLTGALVGALRRWPLRRVALRIDRSHDLADRLGSALEFSALDGAARTPMMECAIADAARAAARVTPALAAPLVRPPHLGAAALVGVIAVAVAFLDFPVAGPGRVSVALPSTTRLSIDRDLLEPDRDAARELARAADESHDPEMKAIAEEMRQLFDQLDRRELTRKEVFDKLDELEKRALRGDAGDFDELKRKLRKAGLELGKDPLAKPAAEALKKDQLAEAKKKLEELADKLEKDTRLDEKQLRSLAKAMEQAAKDPDKDKKSPEDKKLDEQRKQLEQEQRRLQKQQQQDQTKQEKEETARKLQRNQRQLQKLERKQQQQADNQRRLQRMQRQMQQSAQQMQNQRNQSAQSMRNAARELGQMEDEIRKLGNSQMAQGAISEVKELVRRQGNGQGQGEQGEGQGESVRLARSGQPREGQGEGEGQGQGKNKGKSGKSGQGGDQEGHQGADGKGASNGNSDGEGEGGKDGPGKGQKGKNGQDGDGGQGQNGGGSTKLGRFLKRAKGGDPGAEKYLIPEDMAEKGDQKVMKLGKGKPGNGGGGEENGPPSDGAGDTHDPNVSGDPTRLASKRQMTEVTGRAGAGPSRSSTILGAAEKGFASTAYRRVYSDYASVNEEVMSNQQVPPGYRFYVKRYFQLIKPRE